MYVRTYGCMCVCFPPSVRECSRVCRLSCESLRHTLFFVRLAPKGKVVGRLVVRVLRDGYTQTCVWNCTLSVSVLHCDPRFLRFSDCPRVAASPWHSLDGNLPIWAARGFPLVVRLALPGWSPSDLVSGSSSPSQPRHELLCSAAPPGQPFFLELRGLRFVLPFVFRVPGAVSLGHTGSLLGYSEQGVLFPGGSKVMVMELLKACPF